MFILQLYSTNLNKFIQSQKSLLEIKTLIHRKILQIPSQTHSQTISNNEIIIRQDQQYGVDVTRMTQVA